MVYRITRTKDKTTLTDEITYLKNIISNDNEWLSPSDREGVCKRLDKIIKRITDLEKEKGDKIRL